MIVLQESKNISLTVYHGSEEAFDKFDFSKGGSQQGKIKHAIHFTTDRDAAEYYGWNVYEVKVSIPEDKCVVVDYESIEVKKGTQTIFGDILKNNPETKAILLQNVRDPDILSDILLLLSNRYIVSIKKVRE